MSDPSIGRLPEVPTSLPAHAEKPVPEHARAVHHLSTRNMKNVSELGWKDYIFHVLDFTGGSKWIPVGVVDEANGIFAYAKIADIKKLGITNEEIAQAHPGKKLADKQQRARTLETLVKEAQVSNLLTNALCDKESKEISQALAIASGTNVDVEHVWTKVFSSYTSDNADLPFVRGVYKACVLKKEMERQNVGTAFDQLIKITVVAEKTLAHGSTAPLMIKKGGDSDLAHSLLIDFQKKTFTVLGAGPVKMEGSFGKVRSAIEVSMQQIATDASEQVVASHIVRKTYKPGVTIGEKELDYEKLFGSLHTMTTYEGKHGVTKTMFTMEAYEKDLFEALWAREVAARSHFSLEEKLLLLSDIASQLEFMHETHGVVHDDLKTENVMLRREKDGNVHAKIIDFGLCYKPADGEKPRHEESYGTPEFTSPEVLQNHGKPFTVDQHKAKDMYALGCIAYALKNGDDPPWCNDTKAAIHSDAVRQNVLKQQQAIEQKIDQYMKVPPKTVDEEFDFLICRMLHPDPEKRTKVSEARSQIAALQQKISS
jgi:hypothetical protein